MTVSEIIKQVRWCVDEETGYQDFEDKYFDNIIKSKIGAALHWCGMFADASLLNDGTSSSFSNDHTIECAQETKSFTIPVGAIRIVRVRVSTWHKAVMTFISEDSDEYLMQSDDTSRASDDRPAAAIIMTTPAKVELFPPAKAGSQISYSIIGLPSASASDDTSDIAIPSKLEAAFIYYLAFLAMAAHSDMNKANAMLSIAKQHLSLTVDE